MKRAAQRAGEFLCCVAARIGALCDRAMRHSVLAIFLSVGVSAVCARANIASCVVAASGATSCTGALDDPTQFFEKTFTLSGQAAINITIQTYGFGGGVNTNAGTVAGGGFDSLIAVFSAAPETIMVDGGGNSLASVPGSAQFFPSRPRLHGRHRNGYGLWHIPAIVGAG